MRLIPIILPLLLTISSVHGALRYSPSNPIESSQDNGAIVVDVVTEAPVPDVPSTTIETIYETVTRTVVHEVV